MSLLPVPTFNSRLLIRVDGNSTIGLGHLVRCQALAQALQPVFQPTLIMREPGTTLVEQLQGAGLTVQWVPPSLPTGLPEAVWLAVQLRPFDIVVLDGYAFSSTYQRLLAETGAALVCLDDLVTPPLWAGLVLNQAGGVGPVAYANVPLAQLCLGPAYALLRPEFSGSSAPGTPAPSPRRLFLNMGGADPDNQTARLLGQLRQHFSGYALEVVTGAAYPYQQQLQTVAQALGGTITLHHNLTASQMAALLRTCQVFVCPPSGVAYECCAIGGVVLVHPTAANQQALFQFLVQAQLALPLAEAWALGPEQLAVLATQQQQYQRRLFDGRAPERLQTVFQSLAAGQRYTVTPATPADAALYFTWANDPAVRHNAVHSEAIAWETHLAWFTKRLQDPGAYLYIVSSADGTPIGQVRIDFEGATGPGLIDYSVAGAYRGQGLGQLLLRRALQRLRHDRPSLAGAAVIGQVKVRNAASARVFERLRFVRQAAVTLRGEEYEVFQLDFPLAS